MKNFLKVIGGGRPRLYLVAVWELAPPNVSYTVGLLQLNPNIVSETISTISRPNQQVPKGNSLEENFSWLHVTAMPNAAFSLLSIGTQWFLFCL